MLSRAVYPSPAPSTFPLRMPSRHTRALLSMWRWISRISPRRACSSLRSSCMRCSLVQVCVALLSSRCVKARRSSSRFRLHTADHGRMSTWGEGEGGGASPSGASHSPFAKQQQTPPQNESQPLLEQQLRARLLRSGHLLLLFLLHRTAACLGAGREGYGKTHSNDKLRAQTIGAKRMGREGRKSAHAAARSRQALAVGMSTQHSHGSTQ